MIELNLYKNWMIASILYRLSGRDIKPFIISFTIVIEIPMTSTVISSNTRCISRTGEDSVAFMLISIQNALSELFLLRLRMIDFLIW